jgi:hypothetical protein
MFQDMSNASRIVRDGFEVDAEQIVGIVALDMQMLGASWLMFQLDDSQLQITDSRHALHNKIMRSIAAERRS